MAKDVNNSFNKAEKLGRLSGKQKISGSVDLQDDKADFVSFRTSGRSSLQASLTKLQKNVNLILFDGDRNKLLTSKNSGKQSEFIDTVLDKGTYFVKIVGRKGASDYKLKLVTDAIEAPDPTTAKFVGLAGDNTLAFFNSDNLNNVTQVGVTGLQSGENLLGVDFRPNTGELFGLGSSNRLYTIDVTTGAATQVGSEFAVPLDGTSFGFDFNPTVDRIRVVSDAGQNLRLVPDTGAVVDADLVTPGLQIDGSLNGATDSIGATAYTNSVSGATTTMQYGIDAATDQLFLQNPPNDGTQTLVGDLGVNFAANAGLDIVTQGETNSAFAVSGSSLYSIDLSTGAATTIGSVKDKTVDIDLFGLAARP